MPGTDFRMAEGRLVTHRRRSLREQRRSVGLLLRRRRIFACAGTLEGITTRLDLALDVASLARCATEILKLVAMGLELVIGAAPVLDRHVRGQEFFAIALGQVCFQLEV